MKLKNILKLWFPLWFTQEKSFIAIPAIMSALPWVVGAGVGAAAVSALTPKQKKVQANVAPLEAMKEERTKRKKELEESLKVREVEAGEREESLKEMLTTQRESREEGLQDLLQARLQETEYQEKRETQLTGEQQAETGMLRSTFTGEKLQDIAVRTEAKQATAKVAVGEAIERGREKEELTFRSMSEAREKMETMREFEEFNQVSQSISQLDQTIFKARMDADIATQRMNAQQKATFGGLLGSIAGIGIGVMTGGFGMGAIGTVLGGQAGGSIGGGIGSL